LSTNHPFGTPVILALFFSLTLNAIVAYADTNDALDVNLNSIYLKNRSQRDFAPLSEVILQLPYPISETAKKTGQGPFGGITYYDNKLLATTYRQQASVMGLGRIYYSSSVPGETPYTFVPYLTFFRTLTITYKDPFGPSVDGQMNTWLAPGVMYAYRFNKHLAFHLDSDIYSYSKLGNNRVRIGYSYLPKWPMILSASFEQVSWNLNQNIAGQNLYMKGDIRELTAKMIIRDPPNGNFSLILGYGSLYNSGVSGFLIDKISTRGRFFGIEASAGVLAW